MNKIDSLIYSTPSCTTCDGEGWLPYDNTHCYRTNITTPTPPVSILPAIRVGFFDRISTLLYEPGFNTDGSGTNTSLTTPNVWGISPPNRCAVWPTNNWFYSPPLNTWIGFSVCLDGIVETKTYYVGVGGDNFFRLSLDNVELLNNYATWPGPPTPVPDSNYRYWHIYPIEIGAGNHTLEVWGLNTNGPGGVGCEIYNNTLSELTGATNLNQLDIIFSTSGFTQFTVVQDTSGNYISSGYTCPSGYVYSVCDGNCVQYEYCEVTTTPDCSLCDPLYTWSTFNSTTCFTFAEEIPIPPTTTITLSSSTNILYSQYGAKIYASNYLKSGIGNVIFQGTSSAWKNVGMNLTDGPMNRCSIWNSTSNEPYNTWVGVSTCLEGEELGKEFYLGIGSNDFFRVVINGEEILNNFTGSIINEPFVYWHVFPITLYSGNNIIEVFGLNISNAGGFGCEIYDNTFSELSSASVYGDLNVVFTTNGITEANVVQDLNGDYLTSGNTCPSGYYYSSCDNMCVEKLYCTEDDECGCLNVRTDIEDIISSTGNTLYSNNTLYVDYLSCDLTPTTQEIISNGYYCYCTTRLTGCLLCDGEGWLPYDDTRCYRTTTTSYTAPTSPYSAVRTYNSVFSSDSTRFYDTYNNDGSGTYISIGTTPVWKNSTSSSTDGPMNRCSIWTSAGISPTPLNTWVGLSDCLEGFTEEKTYYIGIGADNFYRLTIDGGNLLNLDNYTPGVPPVFESFGNWHVYPVVIGPGSHVIEMWGLNTLGPAGFACEIYDNTLSELTGATNVNQLNIIFSTSGYTQFTVVQDTNGNYLPEGYSCPSGYVYSVCDGNCIQYEYCDTTISDVELYYYKDDVKQTSVTSSYILTDDSCLTSEDCCEDICNVTGYCISNTSNEYYNDFYVESGLYNGRPHWVGESNGYVIYYSTSPSQWCLSTSTGGPCLLSGKSPCNSVCPDLCDDIIYEGYCTTTTTIYTPDCSTLDFSAIFDCDVDPTPTTTTTTTPPTTTTTTTAPPCVISVDAEISTYTITPTTTTTTTISITEVVRNCNFNGSVTFNTINDSLNCPTSKKFQDCYNGTIYYTMDIVKTPSNLPLVESMVYEATVNGTNKCLAYMGKTESVSGNMNIVILSESHGDINTDGCLNCNS